jgi:hypothetical protein
VDNSQLIVQQFLGLFSQEVLVDLFKGDGVLSSQIISEFLSILVVIVQDNSKSLVSLLPNIVSFCLSQGGILLSVRYIIVCLS